MQKVLLTCKTIAQVLMGIVGIAALLFLIDFFIDIPLIRSHFGNEWISPYIYISFMLLSASFFIGLKQNFVSTILIELFSLTNILIGVASLTLKFAGIEATHLSSPALIPFPMGVTMIVIGTGVLFQNIAKLEAIAQSLFLAGFCIAFTLIMGYFEGLYSIPFISESPFTTFLTSAIWLLIALSFLLQTPQKGVVRLLLSPSLGGKILRRLLPTVIFIPIVLSWITMIGRVHYNIDLPVDTEIYGFITLLSLVLITWVLCYWISRTDTDRVRSHKLLDTLFKILEKLDKERPFEGPLAYEILQTVAETLEADIAELWLYQPASDALRCEMIWPVSFPEYYKSLQRLHFQPGIGIPGHIFKNKQMLSLNQEQQELFYIGHTFGQRLDVKHVIGFPLLSDKEIVGVILINKLKVEPFSKEIENLTPTIGLILGYYLSLKKTHDAKLDLALLVEATETALFRLDNQGNILTWNKGAEKAFGYSLQEIMGHSLSFLFSKEKKEDAQWIVDKIKKGQSILEFETEMIRKDRTFFDVSLTTSPIEDTRKHIQGSSISVRDITQLKQYANMLEIHDLELEEKNRDLEETNLELQQLTSIVSRDLQEPLRKIKNFGLLIQGKKSDLDHETAAYIERMVGSAEHMFLIINSLLELSGVSKKELRQEKVSLNKIVSDVLTELDVAIHQSNAQVDVGPLPEIEADPTQMYQLFLNIIINSIKYAKADLPPRITIQSETRPHLYRILIQDNGRGIPSQYKEHIFTPFFRVEGNTHFSGTGVGLSICKKIVERHGGHIYAESNEHLGTMFIISLPIPQQTREVAI